MKLRLSERVIVGTRCSVLNWAERIETKLVLNASGNLASCSVLNWAERIETSIIASPPTFSDKLLRP